MARSHRKPGYFVCNGANPKEGKRQASGATRTHARAASRSAMLDAEVPEKFYEPRNRGKGITDSVSKYFGDGRGVAPKDHPMYAKLCRK